MQYDSTVLRPTTQDHTGKPYGRWTVLRFAGYKNRRVYWTCQCQCSTIKDIQAQNLVHHISESCGCLNSELTAARNTTHGMHDYPEYTVWKTMRQRCLSPSSTGYYKYGARGITICEACDDFATFYRDMGPRPTPQHSIERRDNNGPYSPDNCLWATVAEQQRNTRQNVMLTHNGITQCATDWALSVSMPPKIFQQRIRRGWTMEKALTIPHGHQGWSRRKKINLVP